MNAANVTLLNSTSGGLSISGTTTTLNGGSGGSAANLNLSATQAMLSSTSNAGAAKVTLADGTATIKGGANTASQVQVTTTATEVTGVLALMGNGNTATKPVTRALDGSESAAVSSVPTAGTYSFNVSNNANGTAQIANVDKTLTQITGINTAQATVGTAGTAGKVVVTNDSGASTITLEGQTGRIYNQQDNQSVTLQGEQGAMVNYIQVKDKDLLGAGTVIVGAGSAAAGENASGVTLAGKAVGTAAGVVMSGVASDSTASANLVLSSRLASLTNSVTETINGQTVGHGLAISSKTTVLSGGTRSGKLVLADGDAAAGSATYLDANGNPVAEAAAPAGTSLRISGSSAAVDSKTHTVLQTTTNATASTVVTVIGSGASTTADGTKILAAAGSTVTTSLVAGNSGLVITDTPAGTAPGSAVLSAGSASGGTNMTLNNSGVTFAQNTSAAPVRVTGVANGTTTYDAVNFGQLQALEVLMSKGIAASTAAASIPVVEGGKEFAAGVGFGSFNGQSAVAFGASYRFSPLGMIKGSLGTSLSGSGAVTFGLGAGWSW
jgi:hypothetical protein